MVVFILFPTSKRKIQQHIILWLADIYIYTAQKCKNSPLAVIPFDAQIVHIWPLGDPLMLTWCLHLCPFDITPVIFNNIFWFLLWQDTPSSSCIFLVPVLESVIFEGALDLFRENWYQFLVKHWPLTNYRTCLSVVKAMLWVPTMKYVGELCQLQAHLLSIFLN